MKTEFQNVESKQGRRDACINRCCGFVNANGERMVIGVRAVWYNSDAEMKR